MGPFEQPVAVHAAPAGLGVREFVTLQRPTGLRDELTGLQVHEKLRTGEVIARDAQRQQQHREYH